MKYFYVHVELSQFSSFLIYWMSSGCGIQQRQMNFFCTYLTFSFISNGYSCTLSFVWLDDIKYEGGRHVPCGLNFVVLSRFCVSGFLLGLDKKSEF